MPYDSAERHLPIWRHASQPWRYVVTLTEEHSRAPHHRTTRPGDFDDDGVPMSWDRQGGPRGYLIVDFDGNQYTDQFKASGEAAEQQMSLSFLSPTFRAVDLDRVFTWQEERRLTGSLTLHYKRVMSVVDMLARHDRELLSLGARDRRKTLSEVSSAPVGLNLERRTGHLYLGENRTSLFRTGRTELS